MKNVKLPIWQRVILAVGEHPMCSKVELMKELDSNYASINETVSALIDKGYLKTTKEGRANQLEVADQSILVALRMLIKKQAEE